MGSQSLSKYKLNRFHDTIIVYSKSNNQKFNPIYFKYNEEYKKIANKITSTLDGSSYNNLKQILLDRGYTDSVIDDEIQAYLTTDGSMFKDVDNIKDVKENYQKQLKHFLD